jgi:hypothetical protein
LYVSDDVSIPYVAHLEAQRGGCCAVFPYFMGRILELPLTTTQDYSLFYILGDYSIELWKKQIHLIMEKQGLVSFIVHPDYIREHTALKICQDLLAHLSDWRDAGKVWVALPQVVGRFFLRKGLTDLARL